MGTHTEVATSASIEDVLKDHEVYIWICLNGHYCAMSTSGKHPLASMTFSRHGEAIRERHYQRRKARGNHNHEQCPHCPIGVERRAYIVKAVEEVP